MLNNKKEPWIATRAPNNCSKINYKPLVPFGKRLQRLLASRQKPRNDVFTFIGIDSWRKTKAFSISHYVLCLPPGEEPENYVWPVQGCSILVFDTGEILPALIRKLGYVLLASGATCVYVIIPGKKMVIYRGRENQ